MQAMRGWIRMMAIVLGLIVVVAFGSVGYWYECPTPLKVAVARDSDDYRLLVAAAQLLSREQETVRFHLIPVNDVAASAASLEAGDVDIAVVRSDVATPTNGQTLVILHHNAVILVAPVASQIEHVSDLPGRTVGIVTNAAFGAADTNLLQTILTQYELPDGKVKMAPLTSDAVSAAMTSHQVDAILCISVPGTGPAKDVVSAVAQAAGGTPVFVSIDEARAISQNSPALESIEALGGSFGGNPPRPAKEFETLSVSTRLVARGSLKDGVAADVTRLLLLERPAIAQAAPLANRIEAPSTDKSAALPTHPGAADFLDNNEQTFFDNYSDFIYIGAMILSVTGSGIAAAASRLNSRNHAQAQILLQRLLEILKRASNAVTPVELDALEHEVDDILVATIATCSAPGAETTGPTMLNLALDQAQLVIRDRRRALATELPASQLTLNSTVMTADEQ